jgi:hypothetical protein
MNPKMMNSTRTGPIDGTVPPAANMKAGADMMTAVIRILLQFSVKNRFKSRYMDEGV